MQNSNRIIAITGGIGSGKSAVCKILKDLGFPVLSADEIYKNLIKNSDFVKKIYHALNIPYKNGEVFSREKVSNKVFNNKEMLEILNKTTHPIIMQEMFNKSKEYGGFVFNEVPLLFESGFENYYDNIIIVIRPLKDRIQSVLNRDGLSESEINKIIKNQFNYENLSQNNHTIITNDKDLTSLKEKVIEVISEIQKNL